MVGPCCIAPAHPNLPCPSCFPCCHHNTRALLHFGSWIFSFGPASEQSKLETSPRSMGPCPSPLRLHPMAKCIATAPTRCFQPLLCPSYTMTCQKGQNPKPESCSQPWAGLQLGASTGISPCSPGSSGFSSAPTKAVGCCSADISAAVRTHTNPSSHQLQPLSNANSVANCPDTGDGPDLGGHTTPSSCPVEKTHPAAGLMGDMKGSWAQLGRDVQDSKQKGELRKRDLATSGTARAGTGNLEAGAWLRCEMLTPAPGWGERRGTGGQSCNGTRALVPSSPANPRHEPPEQLPQHLWALCWRGKNIPASHQPGTFTIKVLPGYRSPPAPPLL